MKKTEWGYASSDHIHRIHAVCWQPEGEIRGVLQIIHGMTEYIDRYEEFAKYMTERGFLVAGNDHLGHGKSVHGKEDWGYFAKENGDQCLVRDVHSLRKHLQKKYPEVPHIMFGHSMGSFILRRYLIHDSENIDGAVIMGTGAQPEGALFLGMFLLHIEQLLRGDHYRSKLLWNLAFGAYNRRIKHAPTGYEWLTKEEKTVIQYAGDEKCTFRFTLNGYENLFKTIAVIQKKRNRQRMNKKLPILLISGAEDPVGDYGRAPVHLAKLYKKDGMMDVTLKLYPEDRHELLNECDRAAVYEDIYGWIEKKTAGRM